MPSRSKDPRKGKGAIARAEDIQGGDPSPMLNPLPPLHAYGPTEVETSANLSMSVNTRWLKVLLDLKRIFRRRAS